MTEETSSTSQIKVLRLNASSSQSVSFNYLFKVALIGDSGVGKTSILLRFSEGTFLENTASTIGVDFKIISFDLGDNTYAKMQIWDTCGSERFKSLTTAFIKSCPSFILVFDLSRKSTLTNLEHWIDIIKENTNPQLLCFIGNKSDLESEITKEEIDKFSEKYGITYIEASAKNGSNIEEMFITTVSNIYNEIKTKEYNGSSGSSSGFEIGGYKNIDNSKKENNDDASSSNKKKCSC
jgi:small GTP-binding protein